MFLHLHRSVVGERALEAVLKLRRALEAVLTFFVSLGSAWSDLAFQEPLTDAQKMNAFFIHPKVIAEQCLFGACGKKFRCMLAA